MAKSEVKLTKREIDKLAPTNGGPEKVIFDAELAGFGVRVKTSGTKSYILQYRNKFGRLRRLTMARVGDLTPAEARTKALKLRAQIADGADPAAERKSLRKSVTVGELCDLYIEEGKARLRPNTLKMSESWIRVHVKPLLGSLAVASLTRADLERFVRDVTAGKTAKKPEPGKGKGRMARGGRIRGGAGVAARALEMLGAVLQHAVNHEVIDKNPVKGVLKPKRKAYRPPFSFDAVEAAGMAMREANGENETGLRVVRFLMLTGCRRMEALTLKWGMVDRKAHCLRLPDTKTGAQVRPIGRAALDHLASFQPKDAKPDDYVFPGGGKEGYFVGLPKAWARTAKRADIRGVNIHGLRHWFASAAAELNYSELTIAGLLGHAARSVTGRYATAPDSALCAAADRVSLAIADKLDGKQANKVVSLSEAKVA